MMNVQKPVSIKNKNFLFQVELNWLTKEKGILSANDVKGTVYVSKPTAFGGEGIEWSPEHLFLGSLSSCFMSTYLDFAKKMKFEISHFECEIIGQVELIEGRYQFTYINIYPTIYVADESVIENGTLALQKTQKYCLVANSIKPEVIYHGIVLKDPHPRISNQITPIKINYAIL